MVSEGSWEIPEEGPEERLRGDQKWELVDEVRRSLQEVVPLVERVLQQIV